MNTAVIRTHSPVYSQRRVHLARKGGVHSTERCQTQDEHRNAMHNVHTLGSNTPRLLTNRDRAASELLLSSSTGTRVGSCCGGHPT